MIIIKVMGGLGNQLQQYALYRKMEKLGKDVRLDVSWFRRKKVQQKVLAHRTLELDYFAGAIYREASEREIRDVLGRLWEEPEPFVRKVLRKLGASENPLFTETGMYHPEIFEMDQKYLTGYWACDKYYADCMEELRSCLQFPICGKQENKDLLAQLKEMKEEGTEVPISVHIRRGDYLDEANAALFGGICTDAYYEAAIRYMKERFPKAVFYLFSDEPDYVREHYRGKEYHIVDWNRGADSFFDIQLMSKCAHNICANSTFSFWGARLNAGRDKICIRPSVHKNTQKCIPEEMKELWKGWTLITPQGVIL